MAQMNWSFDLVRKLLLIAGIVAQTNASPTKLCDPPTDPPVDSPVDPPIKSPEAQHVVSEDYYTEPWTVSMNQSPTSLEKGEVSQYQWFMLSDGPFFSTEKSRASAQKTMLASKRGHLITYLADGAAVLCLVR